MVLDIGRHIQCFYECQKIKLLQCDAHYVNMEVFEAAVHQLRPHLFLKVWITKRQ